MIIVTVNKNAFNQLWTSEKLIEHLKGFYSLECVSKEKLQFLAVDMVQVHRLRADVLGAVVTTQTHFNVEYVLGLREEVKLLKKSLASEEQRTESQQEENDRLKRNIEDREEEIKDRCEELKKKNQQIDSLAAQTKDLTQRLSLALGTRRFQEKDAQIAQLTQNLVEAGEQIHDLRQKLKLSEGKATLVDGKNGEIKVLQESLKEESRLHKDTNARLQESCAQLRAALDSLETEKSNHANTKQYYTTRFCEFAFEKAEIHAELARLKSAKEINLTEKNKNLLIELDYAKQALVEQKADKEKLLARLIEEQKEHKLAKEALVMSRGAINFKVDLAQPYSSKLPIATVVLPISTLKLADICDTFEGCTVTHVGGFLHFSK